MVKPLWHIRTTTYQAAIKRNELLIHVTPLMDLRKSGYKGTGRGSRPVTRVLRLDSGSGYAIYRCDKGAYKNHIHIQVCAWNLRKSDHGLEIVLIPTSWFWQCYRSARCCDCGKMDKGYTGSTYTYKKFRRICNYFKVKFKTQKPSHKEISKAHCLTGEFHLIFKKKIIPILHKYFWK